MKKSNKIIFFIIGLLLMQAGVAVPVVNKESVINLAMLEIVRQEPINTSSKQGFIKPKVIKYSSNCLNWNAKQITRKAKRFEKTILKYSKLYRVDHYLVKSVITAESCFKTKALSSAGAQGLMQLIPATAKRFGVKNSYNSEQNIRGGIKYLKFLLKRYQGNLKKVIAAYNAGEGKVDKHNGIPPYKETRQYVKNVLRIYALLKPRKSRVKAIYYPPKIGNKAGRYGWQYNRKLAPHLYKQ